jgi:two-component system chemotaxis response regulator CheB
VIALAASAGGLEALGEVLPALPAGFPAAVLVLLHLYPGRESVLAEVLSRQCALPVWRARAGEPVRPGTVYVAPPGRHLLVQPPGILALSAAPPEHYVRPSADPLFRTLAGVFGKRAVAVVLTGRDSDGSGGVAAVRDAGGVVIAQDPASAREPGMPRNSIRTGAVHHVLPLAEIGPALVRLAQTAP